MPKTEAQKAAHAAKERERRAADKAWLESLPETERAAVKAERSEANKNRRAKHKTTLTEEEKSERRANHAAYEKDRQSKKREGRVRMCQNGLHDLAVTGIPGTRRCTVCREAAKVRLKAYMREYDRARVVREREEFEKLPLEQQAEIKVKQAAYLADYYNKNSGRIRTQKKAYHDANRGSILEKKKAYKEKNPEIIRRNSRAAQARRRAAFRDNLTCHDMEAIKASSNCHCDFCLRLSSRPLELEHCIPISRGGTTRDNLVAADQQCNRGPRGKHSSTPLEFTYGWPHVTPYYDINNNPDLEDELQEPALRALSIFNNLHNEQQTT